MEKQRKNFTIEVYAPYCSVWCKVATLPFAPSTTIVESIVAAYVKEFSSSIDRWRVRHGHKVVGSYCYSR